MNKFISLLGAALVTTTFGATAYAASSPDVYVVNFRNNSDVQSQRLDSALASAVPMAGVNAEEVVIDTSNAAKWEKGAYDAFDYEIVPIFNKWVGLPGFAAVVNAKTKHVIGCVNPSFAPREMAQALRKMTAQAKGQAYMSKASVSGKTTRCPAAHNEMPAG